MHFDLADLRLLSAITASGSLSKAAASIPVAVSAASIRLRQFEARCEVTVFIRKADGMHLTPAGRLVLEAAGNVLGEAQKLQDTLKELAGQRRITLSLAATTVTSSSLLPAVLGMFLADYPQVDLQLTEYRSADVMRAVLSGECEIGVFDGSVISDGIMTLPFRSERLVMLVPTDHPLAERGHTRLRDALDYPFIGMPGERAMQRFVEEHAMKLAMPLQIRVRAPSFEAIAQLVAQRAGIAMLPETTALRMEQELPVRMVLLDEGWATLELRLCIKSWDSLSVHARELVSFLSQQPV